MYALALQDWTTIQGASATPGAPITQTEAFWLDMSGFLDLVTFIEVKEVSGLGAAGIAIAYQTSPTKDEALFQNMNDSTVTLATGVTVGVYLRDTALCPLSHWLRWQLLPPSAAAWNMTFRVWVVANQPGSLTVFNAATGAVDGQGAGGPAWTNAVGVGGGPSGPTPLNDINARRLGSLGSIQSNAPIGFSPYLNNRPWTGVPVGETGTRVQRPGHRNTLVSATVPNQAVAWNPFIGPKAPIVKK